MNVYAIGSFTITLLNLMLWGLTFTKRNLSPLAKAYFWWSFFIALWAFGYGITLSGLFSYPVTLFWNKFCQSMATMIGPYFFRFGCCVADSFPQNRKIYRFYFYFAIVNAALLFLTPYYVKGLWSFGPYRYQPLGGPLYVLFTGFFYWCTIHGFIVAAAKFKNAIGRKKKQIQLFLLATGIAYSGGGTLFWQAFHIPFPSYGVFLILAYVIIIGYAIHKYKFMDFPVLIRKSVVFAGLFSFIATMIAALTYVLQKLFIPNALIAQLVSLAAILMVIEPVRNLLANWTDRYLFQKKEQLKVILTRLSREIITILDIDRVGKKILSAMQDSLHLEAGVIMLKEPSGRNFKMLDSFGIAQKQLEFAASDGFIKALSVIERPINLEDITEKEATPQIVKNMLERLGCIICIPLQISDEMIGVLTLGKKKSDEEFTKEEIDLFPALAGQVAIALSNARLYDTLKKSQIDFAQQAKMAAIGTLSAGISHEIKNPLNHIRVGIGMLKLNKKHGVYSNFTKEQFENEVYKTLEIFEENVIRANSVIERLSSFAKKPKELKIEAVDLKQVVETGLNFLENEFKQYGIEVEKDFTAALPLIQADRHTMEDVFLNLLVNARHAIEQKGKITVKGYVQNEELFVDIQDTGKGISQENQEKIFDPFFTTKDVSRNPDKEAIKGSGLGLFIVREFVQRFGGHILLKSEVGKGTTFHIIFPASIWIKNEAVMHG